MNAAKCLCQVNNGNWCQESYETASRDAGRRAKILRNLGYQVRTGSLGSQVTQYGTVKLTMIDIRPGTHSDTYGLPEVEKI